MKLIKRIIRVIGRNVKKLVRLRKAKQLGLRYIAPNFLYLPLSNSQPVVIDAGCSYEADFSKSMMKLHNARVYAVDPTLKHRPSLKKIEEENGGQFTHIPFAIAAKDGTLQFHESKKNESGSLLSDHLNIRRDETVNYEVTAVTLRSLVRHIGVQHIDILKLDIEGEEYELFEQIQSEDLAPFAQIFVEFHHHALTKFGQRDTQKIVDKICACGFKSFSLDDHNYLFRADNARGELHGSAKPLTTRAA